MPNVLSPLNLNKNELQNGVFQILGAAPSNPALGQFYFDSVIDSVRVYTATGWVNLKPVASGGFTDKGNWNASTNTPTLASGVGTNGDIYKVSVSGSTALDGFSAWDVGDQLFFDGTAWVAIDNTQFATVAALTAKANKFAQDVGDGSATAIVVTHNLNTRDVSVMLRRNTAPYDQVLTDVELTSANSVTLRFSTAPTAAQYRAVVVG